PDGKTETEKRQQSQEANRPPKKIINKFLNWRLGVLAFQSSVHGWDLCCGAAWPGSFSSGSLVCTTSLSDSLPRGASARPLAADGDGAWPSGGPPQLPHSGLSHLSGPLQ